MQLNRNKKDNKSTFNHFIGNLAKGNIKNFTEILNCRNNSEKKNLFHLSKQFCEIDGLFLIKFQRKKKSLTVLNFFFSIFPSFCIHNFVQLHTEIDLVKLTKLILHLLA